MDEELAEVKAIAENPEAPTFENTIIALEKSGQVLGRATSVFYNLVGTDPNDVRQKLRAEYAPKFSAAGAAISRDADTSKRKHDEEGKSVSERGDECRRVNI